MGKLNLACIDHKSLEICDRCRLWQRTSPATPKISLLFFEIKAKQVVWIFRISITALKLTRSVCFRAFQPAMSWSLHDSGDFCGLEL
jgi:hypothetical protein